VIITPLRRLHFSHVLVTLLKKNSNMHQFVHSRLENLSRSLTLICVTNCRPSSFNACARLTTQPMQLENSLVCTESSKCSYSSSSSALVGPTLGLKKGITTALLCTLKHSTKCITAYCSCVLMRIMYAEALYSWGIQEGDSQLISYVCICNE
jgi:hypothetical protein